MKTQVPFFFLMLVLAWLPFTEVVNAQGDPDPRGAFIRSLAVPGWGHYYADRHNWNRGKLHLGAEVALIATYTGLLVRSSNLEERYYTLAVLRADVNLDSRSRSFQLAVGDYDNLAAYNDYQLRTRNWNRILDHNSENQWHWQHPDDRNRYNQLRSNRDRLRSQLPGLMGLMAVNRVVSAISAYNHARNNTMPEISVHPVLDENGTTGAAINLLIRF